MLFDVRLDSDCVGCNYGLVFRCNVHEFEVTDEWGPDWYVVVHPLGVGSDNRSRSSTPEHSV
jgi:hypothetical protein